MRDTQWRGIVIDVTASWHKNTSPNRNSTDSVITRDFQCFLLQGVFLLETNALLANEAAFHSCGHCACADWGEASADAPCPQQRHRSGLTTHQHYCIHYPKILLDYNYSRLKRIQLNYLSTETKINWPVLQELTVSLKTGLSYCPLLDENHPSINY